MLQLRGTGVMWQKERLLNIAAARLPKSARKVGWFDADIVFKEPDWLERTSHALDRYAVVQPFSHAVRLTATTSIMGPARSTNPLRPCSSGIRDRPGWDNTSITATPAMRGRRGAKTSSSAAFTMPVSQEAPII